MQINKKCVKNLKGFKIIKILHLIVKIKNNWKPIKKMWKEFKRCNIEKISYFILNINRLKMIKIKFKCHNISIFIKEWSMIFIQ